MLQARIPGVDPECLIEILGHVYGQNDAPAAWYRVFDQKSLEQVLSEVSWTAASTL